MDIKNMTAAELKKLAESGKKDDKSAQDALKDALAKAKVLAGMKSKLDAAIKENPNL
jgi:hypothetical protein